MGKRVLLLCNSLREVTGIYTALMRNFFTVDRSDCAAEAHSLLSRTHYDAVLISARFQGGADQIARAVQNQKVSVPPKTVLLCHPDELPDGVLMDCPFDDIFPMPYAGGEIVPRLRQMLRNREQWENLLLQVEGDPELGFAEHRVGFERRKPQDYLIHVLARNKELAMKATQDFRAKLPYRFEFTRPDHFQPDPNASLIMICGRNWRALSAVSAQSSLGNLPKMLLLDAAQKDDYRYAIESGASECLMADDQPERIALRIERLVMAEARARQLRDAMKDRMQQALKDHLTGLPNRRMAEHFLTRALQKDNTSDKLGLLMIDVDDFKRINDCFGHRVGDQVLCRLADLLRKNLRAHDLVARFGGDEFLAVFPDIGDDTPQLRADALCACIAEQSKADDLPEFTVSIGVATNIRGHSTPTSMIVQADHALYRAKSAGRNQARMTAA